MAFWQNAIIFVLLGCVVYFPVLLVECIRQSREIARLREILEGVVVQKRKKRATNPAVGEYKPMMWTVTETEGEKR